MASIQFSSMVSDIRGSIGGNTFSRNASGSFACRRTKGKVRNTSKQSLQKSLFATLSSSWKMLTEEQRTQWNLAAPNYPRLNRFGQPVTLTGQQAYMLINSNFQAAQLNTTDWPPTWSGITAPGITGVTAQTASPQLTIHLNPLPDEDSYLIISATAPISQGISFVSSKLKQIAGASFGAVGDIGLSDYYIPVFGSNLQEGTKIFVAVSSLNPDTGQRSAVSINSGIVVGI